MSCASWSAISSLGFGGFGLAQGGVEFFDGNGGVGGFFLLILHEGDERGDDDDRFGQEERGKLVGEGLAGAGRHEGKRVPLPRKTDSRTSRWPGRNRLMWKRLFASWRILCPGDLCGAGLRVELLGMACVVTFRRLDAGVSCGENRGERRPRTKRAGLTKEA